MNTRLQRTRFGWAFLEATFGVVQFASLLPSKVLKSGHPDDADAAF